MFPEKRENDISIAESTDWQHVIQTQCAVQLYAMQLYSPLFISWLMNWHITSMRICLWWESSTIHIHVSGGTLNSAFWSWVPFVYIYVHTKQIIYQYCKILIIRIIVKTTLIKNLSPYQGSGEDQKGTDEPYVHYEKKKKKNVWIYIV